MSAAVADEFSALLNKGVDAQAEHFLRAFLTEFMGRFEEVHAYQVKFKLATAAQNGKSGRELDEVNALAFFNKQGHTITATQLRKFMHEHELDGAGRVTFIEFLMFVYGKTADNLFLVDRAALHPVLQKLHDALEVWEEECEKNDLRARKMAQLEVASDAGGLTGGKARVELTAMQREDLTDQNRRQVALEKALRTAQRWYKDNDPERAELERVANAKAAADDANREKRKQAMSRIAEFHAQMGMK